GVGDGSRRHKGPRLPPHPTPAGRRPPALRRRSGGDQPRPVPARQALTHQAATFLPCVNRGWSTVTLGLLMPHAIVAVSWLGSDPAPSAPSRTPRRRAWR